jgi:hypothetical protein
VNLLELLERNIRPDIRRAMEVMGCESINPKAWVVAFIQDVLPEWEPGERLSHEECELVGREFSALLPAVPSARSLAQRHARKRRRAA